MCRGQRNGVGEMENTGASKQEGSDEEESA